MVIPFRGTVRFQIQQNEKQEEKKTKDSTLLLRGLIDITVFLRASLAYIERTISKVCAKNIR